MSWHSIMNQSVPRQLVGKREETSSEKVKNEVSFLVVNYALGKCLKGPLLKNGRSLIWV